MSAVVETAASAEAEVEHARAALALTLDQLKDNLRPRQLIVEAMARPRDKMAQWLVTYGYFAKHSPLAGVIIGAAALALTTSLVRGDHGKRRNGRR